MTYVTSFEGRRRKGNFICLKTCLFVTNCFSLVCYSQMCLKERWRSTVHCLLSICLTGHLFVCRWLNTLKRWAKLALEKWWARKPRVKWSPIWERDGPRPRIHGLGRKWPSSFIPNREARDHFRILGIGLELACGGGSCGTSKLGSSPMPRLW